VAVAGAILMLVFTRRGIGLWEDSFDYITAARSLVDQGRLGRMDGLGAFRPLTHFPPGYPALLALLNALGFEILGAARWLNVVLFGALILLSGISLWWVSGSWVWGLAASALVATSEVLIGVHLWALTEPLYLVLALAALLLVAAYLSSPGRRVFLVSAALVSAAAFMTRYAGAATVIAGAGALVLLPRREPNRKRVDLLLFLAISCLPVVGFMIRNRIVSGAPTDEVGIAWHVPAPTEWQEAARTVLNWGLPDVVVERLSGSGSLLALSAALLLAAAVGVWISRGWWREWRKDARSGSALGLLLTLYSLVYFLEFLATVLLVRRIAPDDNRLLAPFFLAGVLVLTAALGRGWMQAARIGRPLVALACIAIVGFQGWRWSGLLEVLPDDSRGFAGNSWRTSETIAYVRGLPQAPIYSNEIQAIYFLTGRMVTFIPTPLNPATGDPRTDYPEALARMRERLRTEGGALVLIDPSELSSDELSELTEGLRLVGEFSDGVVYSPPGD
jgi:hypothetical protein